MFTVVLLVVYSLLLGCLSVYGNARRSVRVESSDYCPRSIQSCNAGCWRCILRPVSPICHGCMMKIRSCGDNPKKPDQPLQRFPLPASGYANGCEPVYYHANWENAQVAEYKRVGWYDCQIREHFQTDRRPPPVAMDHRGSSSSQAIMDLSLIHI